MAAQRSSFLRGCGFTGVLEQHQTTHQQDWKDMPALKDRLLAASVQGALRFVVHESEDDKTELEDRMAEVTQMSYQQLSARAE